MLTFKDFLRDPQLLEATLISKKWKVTDLDVKKAIDFLNKNCKDGLKAIANDGVLFRGFKSAPANMNTMVMIDSTKALRTSRDSNNLYQLMFDTSESMADVPSRSSSFICSTSKFTASEISSNVYAMIPVDNTMVAVSSVPDVFSVKMPAEWAWDSNYLPGVEDFCTSLEDFFLCFAKSKSGKFTDSNALNSAMAKFTPEEILVIHSVIRPESDLELKNPSEEDAFMFQDLIDRITPNSVISGNAKIIANISHIAKKYIATGKFEKTSTNAKSLLSILRSNPSKPFTALSNYAADKPRLKITTVKFGQKVEYDKECWFTGKCVAIPIDLFIEIAQEMYDLGIPVGNRTINYCDVYTGK